MMFLPQRVSNMIFAAGIFAVLLMLSPISVNAQPAATQEDELLTLPPMSPAEEAEALAAPPKPAVVVTPTPEVVVQPVVVPVQVPSTPPVEPSLPAAADPADADETATVPSVQPDDMPVAEAPENDVVLPVSGGEEVSKKPDEIILQMPTSPDKPWGGTLMFPKKRMDDLVLIYDAYVANRARLQPKTSTAKGGKGINVTDILKGTLSGGKQQEVPEETLALTLSSIVYYNPNDWSVWLNGNRYFKQDALDGFVVGKSTLRVVSASKQEITLIWTPVPESSARIAAHWQARVDAADQPKPTLMSQTNRVNYNTEDSSVTITLKPNQTFISQQMAVFEGRVTAADVTAVAIKGILGSAAEGAVVASPTADNSGYIPPAPGNLPAEPAATPQAIFPADEVFPGNPD